MRAKARIVIITVLLGFAGAGVAGSLISVRASEDTKDILAEGVGAVVAGNQAKARDEALRDAMRKAIEQAVGTVISSETIVENFQLLSDRIYTQPRVISGATRWFPRGPRVNCSVFVSGLRLQWGR